MAEKLCLHHVSQGEGEDRYILIRKVVKGEKKPQVTKPDNKHRNQQDKNTKSEGQSADVKSKNKKLSKHDESGARPKTYVAKKVVDKTDSKQHIDHHEEQIEEVEPFIYVEDIEKPPELVVCGKCGRQVPVHNMQLHEVSCPGKPPPVVEVTAKVERPKSKNKKKAKSDKVKPEKNPEDDDDFEALIAAAVRENNSCSFRKCKENAKTFGRNCEFCAKRFCIGHHIPEVHGCAERARAKARQMISREGVLYRGSGVPSKKPNPVKRAQLQRKLDKKLDELTDKRGHKKN